MLVYFSNELGLARTERGQPAFPGASPIRQDCMERERECAQSTKCFLHTAVCHFSPGITFEQMFCPGASCPGPYHSESDDCSPNLAKGRTFGL